MEEKNTGKVKWWNSEKGFGVIITDQGKDVFAHHTALQDITHNKLKDGQLVEFNIQQGPKRPQAINIKPISQNKTPKKEELKVPNPFLNTLTELLGKTTPKNRSLKVFLCYSSEDRGAVRKLYNNLKSLKKENIEPWIDVAELLAGSLWERKIIDAIRSSDIVLICLSNTSTTKVGFVQKEMRYIINFADEHPDEDIFLIPLRLEDCIVPQKLERWQWIDYFKKDGNKKLLKALRMRADQLGINK